MCTQIKIFQYRILHLCNKEIVQGIKNNCSKDGLLCISPLKQNNFLGNSINICRVFTLQKRIIRIMSGARAKTEVGIYSRS
jgi:hypothetical protein